MTAPAFVPGDVLRVLPAESAPLVESVLAMARRNRVTVYLVGGPVRDLLLARPIRDVDLLVEPTPDWDAGKLAQEAAPEGARVSVHERFGTASIETSDGGVDLAGLRKESYAQPGALPRVEPGTLEEDLLRRDFSVNALALPLTGGRSGVPLEVVDVTGGLQDLDSCQLRILHRDSFKDDPTRALRAARLGPRLGFSLARGSRSALRDALRSGAFGAVSGDRLRREIDRCFEDARSGLSPGDALRRLSEWHVLPALEPGLILPRVALPHLRRLGRSLVEPPWSGPRLRPGAAGLAVWLADLSPALRRRTLDRFSVRGEQAQRIAGFTRARSTWLKQLAAARGRGAVDAALAGIDEERLYALYASAPTPVRRRIVRWAAEDRSLRMPVNGADLTELGLEGASVGKALAKIRAAVLDGGVANREEALALGRELARRRRPAPARRKGRARS